MDGKDYAEKRQLDQEVLAGEDNIRIVDLTRQSRQELISSVLGLLAANYDASSNRMTRQICPIGISEELDLPAGLVFDALCELAKSGHVKFEGLLKDEKLNRPPTMHDDCQLTTAGAGLYQITRATGDQVYMGDTFNVGHNSNIVNRSQVFQSHVGANNSAILSEPAIQELMTAVEGSDNPHAQEDMELLLDELNSENPRPRLIGRFLQGVQDALPAVKGVADIVAKASEVINEYIH